MIFEKFANLRASASLAITTALMSMTPTPASPSTGWINALVAGPAEIQKFQVGSVTARLVVHHEKDTSSPREGLTVFWLKFPQSHAQMLVEKLNGEAARRMSVVGRLKSSAIPSDIAVLTGGFASDGCAPKGLVIASHDRGDTSITRWENGKLIGGLLVSRGLGQLAIERASDFVARNEIKDGTILDAVQSKPILVMNGADDRVKNDAPSNRIAVGLTGNDEIVIVGAVRSGWSALSLQEMVDLLLIPESASGPGIQSAINLEGAHAQLYIPALDRHFAEDSPTCVPTQLHFRTPSNPNEKRRKKAGR